MERNGEKGVNVIHHRGNTMGRRRSGVGGKKERKREERKEYGRVGVAKWKSKK